MKKLLAIALILVIAMLCVVIPTACNNEVPHEHKFDESIWTYDENFHWHSATCEHFNEYIGKAEHAWGDVVVDREPTVAEDGASHQTCTVCGKEKTFTTPKTSFNSTVSAKLSFSNNESGLQTVEYSPVAGKIYLEFTTIDEEVFYIDCNEQQGLTSPVTENTPKLITKIELYDRFMFEAYGIYEPVEIECNSYSDADEGNYFYFWQSKGLLKKLTDYAAIITLDKEYDTFKFNFHAISKFQGHVSFAEQNYYVKEVGKQYSFLLVADSLDDVTLTYKGVGEPFSAFRETPPTEVGEYEVRAYMAESEYFTSAVYNAFFTIVTRCSHTVGDNGICTKCGYYEGRTFDGVGRDNSYTSNLAINGVDYFRITLQPGEYYARVLPTTGYSAKFYDWKSNLLMQTSLNMAEPLFIKETTMVYLAVTNLTDATNSAEVYVICGHEECGEGHFCTVCGEYVDGEGIPGLNEVQTEQYLAVDKTAYYFIELGADDYIFEEISDINTSNYEYKIYGKEGDTVTLLATNLGLSKFEFTAPYDGDYYIHVTNVSNTNYSSILNGVQFKVCCKTHDYLDHGICGACNFFRGTQVSTGISIATNIAVGEKAYYQFDISTTGGISIVINDDPYGSHGYNISLYNAIGTLESQTGATQYIMIPENTSGTFYIVIENVSDASESATFKIN